MTNDIERFTELAKDVTIVYSQPESEVRRMLREALTGEHAPLSIVDGEEWHDQGPSSVTYAYVPELKLIKKVNRTTKIRLGNVAASKRRTSGRFTPKQ